MLCADFLAGSMLASDPHPHDKDYKFGDITKRMIRDATGNKDYEFGDGSKAISEASMDAAEKAGAAVLDAGGTAVEAGAAAKKALDDSGYQFGDLTKGAIKGFEETIRDATGNDECESLLSAFASLAAALLRCCRRSPFSASVLRLILMLITVCATLACATLAC